MILKSYILILTSSADNELKFAISSDISLISLDDRSSLVSSTWSHHLSSTSNEAVLPTCSLMRRKNGNQKKSFRSFLVN